MKLVKNVIQYILAIMIAITMIVFLVILLISSTVFNKNYTLSKLEETNYYHKTYENVKANFENYIYQSGLEKEVLNDIISEEKVKKDTQLIISNLYDGLEEKIETEEIRNNLNKNIENSLGNTKLIITQRDAINTLIDKICNEYTNTILHNQYEKQINNIYKTSLKYINVAEKASLITMVISIVILLLISKKKIYKGFSLLGIGFTVPGISFIAVNIFICTKVKIQNILILNEAISNVIRNILMEILHNISTYGAILLGTGILFIVMSNFIHNKFKYGNEVYKK